MEVAIRSKSIKFTGEPLNDYLKTKKLPKQQ